MDTMHNASHGASQSTRHSPSHKHEAKIFYLVGASGSGKDSLLRQFRQETPNRNYPVVVAHRYITRKDKSDEDSVYLSAEEFALRHDNDFFAMSWQANDLHYGIGKEIEFWLAAGISVLVNGSRAYLPEAKAKFDQRLHSIMVDVPEHTLRERLRKRSREDDTAIEKRLERHQALVRTTQCDSRISNDRTLESAALEFRQILSSALTG